MLNECTTRMALMCRVTPFLLEMFELARERALESYMDIHIDLVECLYSEEGMHDCVFKSDKVSLGDARKVARPLLHHFHARDNSHSVLPLGFNRFINLD